MTGEQIKVLLIDDDEDDYILTRDLLADVKVGSYALDWASSYEEGLRVIRRREHHVCLVDYRLADRSGVQLIREAWEARLRTPMILLTGHGSRELDVAAMQAGATDYLVKDETPTALLERTIRYAVELNTERTRAEEALGAYAQRQAAVAEIGRLALSGGELKDLFSEVVSLVARTLGVEYCKILELLPDGNSLVLRAGVGWKEEYTFEQATVTAGRESQAGFTLLSNEAVVVRDLRTETRFRNSSMLHEHGVVSGVSVLIRGQEKPYGVLGVHTVSERAFEIDEVNFLRAVAHVLAEAIGRKQAEHELRQSESQFRALFENALDAVLIADDRGAFVDANPAACNLLAVSHDELIGRTNGDFTEEDDKAEALGSWAQLLKEGTMRGEFRLRRADGKIVEIDFTATANFLPGRHLSILRDITERKRTDVERIRLLSELESERMRLADIFTHAPAFICSTRGPEHIYELANAHYYKLVGPRDLIGRRVREAVPEAQGQGYLEVLDQVYLTGVPFVGNEVSLKISDGKGGPLELHYLNFVCQPMTDVNGTVSGIISHGVDVTEQVLSRRLLQESENQLRQSQKLESVGMLAGGIAHDFNNLLTVITGYSDLTLTHLDKADPLARYVEEINKASERATSLTRQLLAFSRKQLLQPRVFDLNTVIANIEKMLGRLVGEDMDLRTFPGVGLGQIKADPGQIEQVILNLVVNARDAMPEGGKIIIETANIHLDEAYTRQHISVQPGWYVMLSVSDTGQGMDAEIQKHIFEPFFTTKEQGKGTGLGLSTAYGIVKQSGGNIWVYSEVGIGTSFKIYLPLVDEQVTQPEKSPVCQFNAPGTETILLAEDEEMVRNLVRESLKLHGYRVLEAANGEEALLIVKQQEGTIHLLLTDVVMPRMSGKELAEQLLKLRPDTRVLYMSGYADRAIVLNGILDGNVAFIGKPFTPDALALKVAEVLKQKVCPSQSLEEIDPPTPADGKEENEPELVGSSK
ncbi:MAG: domain S-box-containing protein [Acidobacteria bacterium]|nr:domain S-box-containing protein [Acidobacteriota bacterium]